MRVNVWGYAPQVGTHEAGTRQTSLERIMDVTIARILAAPVASFRVVSRSAHTIVGFATTRNGEPFEWSVMGRLGDHDCYDL